MNLIGADREVSGTTYCFLKNCSFIFVFMELFNYTYQGKIFESRTQHFVDDGYHRYKVKLGSDLWLVIAPSDDPKTDSMTTWVQSIKPGEIIQKQELIQAMGQGLESVGLEKIIVSSMNFKEYLDYCVTHYYAKVIEKFDFKLSETYTKGLGAFYTYKNDFFRLQIVNDRGIVNGYVASLHETERFVDIDILFKLIRLSGSEGKFLGARERKMIISKTLSCEEEAPVIDSYYTNFVDLLSVEKYTVTLELLEKLFKERFNATINHEQ